MIQQVVVERNQEKVESGWKAFGSALAHLSSSLVLGRLLGPLVPDLVFTLFGRLGLLGVSLLDADGSGNSGNEVTLLDITRGGSLGSEGRS